MASTTARFAGGAPEVFGKSGAAAGFSCEHCSQISRTRLTCLTTAQAGQRPGGEHRGAPGRAPRTHRCARQMPSACGSALEAGRH
eukprot:9706663-Alexandrium_andersonii.AAC.1